MWDYPNKQRVSGMHVVTTVETDAQVALCLVPPTSVQPPPKKIKQQQERQKT
jgi:hypothetical protein